MNLCLPGPEDVDNVEDLLPDEDDDSPWWGSEEYDYIERDK